MITRDFFIKILDAFLAERWIDLHRQFNEAPNQRNRHDWVWYIFVQSYATNGGVKNWESFIKSGRENEISWNFIIQRSDNDLEEAQSYISNISNDILSKRRRHATLPALLDTFERIYNAGGPEAVANEWNTHKETDALLSYLKGYRYIGDKYARNMCMDIADPLVCNNFAFDSRLNKVLENVEGFVDLRTYAEKEEWLHNIVNDIPNIDEKYNGWCCWHIDRLIFQNEKNIMTIIRLAEEPEFIRNFIRHHL